MTGGPDLRSIRMLNKKRVRRSHKELDEPILVSHNSIVTFLLLIVCPRRSFNVNLILLHYLCYNLFRRFLSELVEQTRHDKFDGLLTTDERLFSIVGVT